MTSDRLEQRFIKCDKNAPVLTCAGASVKIWIIMNNCTAIFKNISLMTSEKALIKQIQKIDDKVSNDLAIYMHETRSKSDYIEFELKEWIEEKNIAY